MSDVIVTTRGFRIAAAAIIFGAFVASSSPECAGRFVRERVISRYVPTSMDAAGNAAATVAWLDASRALFPGEPERRSDGTLVATGKRVIRGGAETMQGHYSVVFSFRDRGIYAVTAVGPATENYRLRTAVEEFVKRMLDDYEAFLKKNDKPRAE